MNPAHVEAVKSIKNAVANKAFLHSKKLASAYVNRMYPLINLIHNLANQPLTPE